MKTENMLDVAARLHWNSLIISMKKIENEYQTPKAIARVKNPAATTTQP
jgi:hypothetical protein